MKKIRDNFVRTNSVIQSDKSVMSDGCKALVLQDFAGIFEEYFELNGLPEMNIVCEKGVYKVSVTFEADRVKNSTCSNKRRPPRESLRDSAKSVRSVLLSEKRNAALNVRPSLCLNRLRLGFFCTENQREKGQGTGTNCL